MFSGGHINSFSAPIPTAPQQRRARGRGAPRLDRTYSRRVAAIRSRDGFPAFEEGRRAPQIDPHKFVIPIRATLGGGVKHASEGSTFSALLAK